MWAPAAREADAVPPAERVRSRFVAALASVGLPWDMAAARIGDRTACPGRLAVLVREGSDGH